MGGTKSGDTAARYVLRKFRELGLKAEIIEDPEKIICTNGRWSLKVEEPKSLRGIIKNEWLAMFSPTVKSTKAYLTYVTSEDEIKEQELDSTAILTEKIITPNLYQELAKAGCVCVLSFAPGVEGKYTDWAMITSLRSSAQNPVPVFNLSYKNGIKLKNEILRGTKVTIRFSSQTKIARGKPKTVIAKLQGKSDEYYIVCAHGDSDSGGPGADDNASGVAGTLELARTLNSLVRAKSISVPKTTIKFIVWGSEYFSTENYVKQNAEQLGKILGVMNFDEIGTGATRRCLYFESNDIPHNKELLNTFQSVGETYVGKKGFWEEATTNPSQGGTDSYVFLPDYLSRLKVPEVKIPSVTIYTAAWDQPKTIAQTPGWSSKAWKGHPDSVTIDYSTYYHSSLDVPWLTTDKEPFKMIWAVKAVGITLWRLAW